MYVYCINSFGTATVGVIDITSSRDFPAIDLYLSRADSVMLFYDEDDDTSVRELLHLHDKVKAVREERTDMHVTIKRILHKNNLMFTHFDQKNLPSLAVLLDGWLGFQIHLFCIFLRYV